MSYDSKRKEFSRERIDIVEIELEKCALTYGTSPCTAQVGVTGSEKCHNTFATCQDVANYDGSSTQTHRFCTKRSPHPIGINAIPCLERVDAAAQQIDIRGGLGTRASVSATFTDFPSSDIGIDPYVAERSYDPLERGTFFTKLRARNPNYQYRNFKHIVTYLDGDGVYNSSNDQERLYLIEKLEATKGQARIIAKDPLIKAMSKKALVPTPSDGKLQSNITASATSLTMNPSGVGADYPSSGTVVIGKEIITYSSKSGDTLNGLTRGTSNTTAAAHNSGDTVQICYEQSLKKVNEIVEDLFVNYAGVDSAYINSTSWESEVDSFMSTLLTGIIPKPTDVNKILKELSQAAPHYLYWDERENKINLVTLKSPPTSAAVLNMDEHLIADSVSVGDRTDLRKSTIFVHFGQFDPTKKVDEPENYEVTYARVDTDSIAEYGSSEVETIFCRWIPSTSEASARRLAALIGRRFRDIPREINFSLDPKDAELWAGDTTSINHRDVLDPTTALPKDTIFQILSVKEDPSKFTYKGLEFTYGEELSEDEGGGDPNVDLVFIEDEATNINLRSLYDLEYGTPDSSTIAKFILDAGRVCGSTSVSSDSIDTGTWPAGATVILEIKPSAKGLGKGGRGASNPSDTPEDGGDCINMQHDLKLINSGIIGGGGGGGESVTYTSIETGSSATAAGGGGAGYEVGTSAGGSDGTHTSGGNGERNSNNGAVANGGKGGDLGQAGQSGSGIEVQNAASGVGAAGVAIKRNGHTLTDADDVAYPSGDFGDVRGSIT